MKSKRIIKALLILLPLLMTVSCVPLKDIEYIRPDESLQLNEYGMIKYNRPVYHLQPYDMLIIKVAARPDLDLGELEDFTTSGFTQTSSNTNQLTGQGVLIREDGYMELPRIGKLYMEGLTIEEAREKIEKAFYKIFEEDSAYIEVNVPGINFTIVGEAGSGNYSVPQYEFSLLEAFATAGSLTPLADWKHIQILRTTPEGTQRAQVDITKESVMNSEYFWVQPNDIIIVNPRRQKQWGIGINPIQTITTILGGIAAIIGVYYFFKNL